jgi:hypothetical protein
MTKRLGLICLTVNFGLWISAVHAADYLTGNDVRPICTKVIAHDLGRTLNEAAYIGHCTGMIETLLVLGPYFQSNVRYCVPGTVTVEQGVKVFIAFLDANPRLLDAPADVLALKAFRAAWPCK